MTAIEDRLVALGDELDLGGESLVDDVLTRLGQPAVEAVRPRVALRVAAAAVLVVAVAVVAIPDARRTVAGWFGWESVSVERRPDLDPPATTTPIADGSAAGEVVVVDGREILVTTIDARLDVGLVRKTVGSESGVVETAIGGRLALWIHGEPHLVSFIGADGSVIDERVAGDTLLWQTGDVTVRVEGFDDLDDAIEFAEARAAGE